MIPLQALPPPASRPWIAVALASWLLAAVIAVEPVPEPIAGGRVAFDAVLVTDVIPGRFGPYALAETGGVLVLLDLDTAPPVAAGERVTVEGVANGEVGRARGIWHASAVTVDAIEPRSGASTVPMAVGNAMRRRVMERLVPFDDGRALLAGFLIGDTTELDPSDVEAMRLSGLAHYVAVSGSNVALFLVLLAVAAGPLAMGPRRRALIGLLGLPVYAAATRFEPSVMRASLMAGIALTGRVFGVVLEAWQLLSLAVVVLLALDPALASNVGFQLSVAATAGVLVGGRWPLPGGTVRRALSVTVGAQLAVAPLLITHFGSVPLLSPVVNVVSAPLVAASTLIGAVGVAVVSPLVDVASFLAGLVLSLARGTSSWPQLGAVPWALTVAAALVVWRFQRLRSPAAVLVASLAVASALGGGGSLPEHGVVVLDVGQGDAILIHSEGRFALVDGGPDPVVLIEKLRGYGVTVLDLVVLTHVHADHAMGLTGVVGALVIGEVWAATEPHETPASRELIALVEALRVPIRGPSVGEVFDLGALRLEVLAPARRYKSPNDQSIVLMVSGERTMLLSGDIELFAQRDLGGIRADVLKVPHQGAATSERDWLVGVGASLAVISVGPNQFGHPAEWVVDALQESGATVLRTDRDGDVAVDLIGAGRP